MHDEAKQPVQYTQTPLREDLELPPMVEAPTYVGVSSVSDLTAERDQTPSLGNIRFGD